MQADSFHSVSAFPCGPGCHEQAGALWVQAPGGWLDQDAIETFTTLRVSLGGQASLPGLFNLADATPQAQWTQAVSFSLQLTLTIRTLLKNLKVKIDLLKDLLLRAVSTRQMYPCKHFHLFWSGRKNNLKTGRNLGHPDFSTAQGGLGFHTVAIILHSVLSVCSLLQ
jgi:hypothetical protein